MLCVYFLYGFYYTWSIKKQQEITGRSKLWATYHWCLAPLSFFKHIWTCILCVPEPGWSICTGRNKDKVCLHEWRYRRGSERTVDLTDRFDQSIRIKLHNNGNIEKISTFSIEKAWEMSRKSKLKTNTKKWIFLKKWE